VVKRIATGLADSGHGAAAFAQAASGAAAGLRGEPADFAVVFAGGVNVAHLGEGLEAVADVLPAKTVIGCGAQGVVGSGRELEQGGVAVWAASLPGARIEPFHVRAQPHGDDQVAVTGVPDLDEAEVLVALVDPYSFPIEPMLQQLALVHPGLPVVGGLASAGAPGGAALVADGRLVADGAVGVTLAGVEVETCVSQGARPVGPEMVVTEAEGNVIYQLASKPALERLHEAIAELSPSEQMLAATGVLVGIVVDENQPDYERGDFLIRGLLGVDEEEHSVTIGEQVRVGQTVRLQVRDAESADEDLHHALDAGRARLSGPASGALIFTCNGRGSHMFGSPDHDARVLQTALGGAPAAGFFCAGEIGPVGPRNFVHGFTATIAVFGP
jgi:small ligand-binding sensory domain FIST